MIRGKPPLAQDKEKKRGGEMRARVREKGDPKRGNMCTTRRKGYVMVVLL
jgi:hypothetical protein